jgi:hypothetical protein
MLTEDKLSPDKMEKMFSAMLVDGKIAVRGVAICSVLVTSVRAHDRSGVIVFLCGLSLGQVT